MLLTLIVLASGWGILILSSIWYRIWSWESEVINMIENAGSLKLDGGN